MERKTHIYIYTYTYTYVYIYIYIPILFIHPRFDTKITSDSYFWWFFLCKFAWLQPGNHVFFQPEAFLTLDFLGPTVPGATEQFAKEAFARVEAEESESCSGWVFDGKKPELSGLPRKNVTSKWSRLKRLGKNLQCKVYIHIYTYICNMYIMYTQCKVKVVQHVLLTPPVAPNSTGFSINYLLVAELYPAVAPKIWNLNHKSLD